MKIQFEKLMFRPNKFYDGRIENVVVDEKKNCVYFFVTLDMYPGESFLKSLPFSKNIQGLLACFLDDLGVLDDNDSIELDDLCNEEVRVTLTRGKNKQWFVDEMELINSDEDEDDELEDDE